MPARVVCERANVRALASMSSMLSAICLPLMQAWWLETVSEATCEAGRLKREEVISLLVLEREMGLVSLGARM